MTSSLVRRINLIFLCLIGISSVALAQEYPAKPQRLVLDQADLLSPEEESYLENKLVQYNDTTSTQIAIVIIEDLGGYEISQYATGLAHDWGIGQKDKNNGLLILISKSDRKMFIATGYGLEAVIPDAVAKRIIQNDLRPAFKQNRYAEGLDKATSTLMSLASNEFSGDEYIKKHSNGKKDRFPGFLVWIVLFIIIVVAYSKFSGARKYSRANHIPFWLAWSLLNASTSSYRGRWGDFSSGSGSFGGSGGFGGFGGGGFGGGGAGGDW